MDKRLARDLAKNAGPTDNAGNPVTVYTPDRFTFVAPQSAPTAEDDAEPIPEGSVPDAVPRGDMVVTDGS